MTDARTLELAKGAKLTDRERSEGWRFCCMWGGKLTHKTAPESEWCYCLKAEVLKNATQVVSIKV